jgi:hypothetical protein
MKVKTGLDSVPKYWLFIHIYQRALLLPKAAFCSLSSLAAHPNVSNTHNSTPQNVTSRTGHNVCIYKKTLPYNNSGLWTEHNADWIKLTMMNVYVCVCVSGSLITKDRILPSYNYNFEHKTSYKTSLNTGILRWHTGGGTLNLRVPSEELRNLYSLNDVRARKEECDVRGRCSRHGRYEKLNQNFCQNI